MLNNYLIIYKMPDADICIQVCHEMTIREQQLKKQQELNKYPERIKKILIKGRNIVK